MDETSVKDLLHHLVAGDYVWFRQTATQLGLTVDLLALLQSLNPYEPTSSRSVLQYTAGREQTEPFAQMQSAWTSLTSLACQLKQAGLEQLISFDLTLYRDISYYTGIVFESFAAGVSAPIVVGGRYDNLLQQFGANAPAIGFTFEVERLLAVCGAPVEQTTVEVPDRC